MLPTKIFVALGAVLFASQLFALSVNRVNGGLSVTYTDFSISGGPLNLELARSYNSISAVNENTGWWGAFGWGWTSAFETTLTITPERHVILRDGATGNVIFFKPQKEDPAAKEAFMQAVKTRYFEKKMGRQFTENQLNKMKLPMEMERQLKNDPDYRLQIASKYNIGTPVPREEVLISGEYGYQTLQYKNNKWIREKDAFTQHFDREGRLIRQVDRSGTFYEYRYAAGPKGQLTEIVTSDRGSNLRFTFSGDRVTQVTDSRNRVATYVYDAKGNLTQSKDSTGNVYEYKYENRKFPHLLTQVLYVSESSIDKQVSRSIQYDDNGLVISHRDKDGDETQYIYGRALSNSENNFWTKKIAKINGKTEESYDEFLLKARPDGTKYLYKQESREAGVTLSTIYMPCCGKPLQVTRNGNVTNYKYYENGLLKERISEDDSVSIEYDPRWRRASRVTQNGLTSYFEYDARGNLTRARNSNNQNVSLSYDRFGRIFEMVDTKGRKLGLKYDDQSRPVVVTQKGMGTIRLEYDSEGKIRKAESLLESGGRKPSTSQSQEMVRKVMESFRGLMDIIRPATNNFIG